MNELQRQAYMDAMNVDCYVPRLLLPAAKASTLCVMPVIPEAAQVRDMSNPSTANQPFIDSVRQTGGDVTAMQALLAESVLVVNRSVASKNETNSNPIDANHSRSEKQPTQKSAIQEIPHFLLTVIRGSSVLMIDDCVPTGIAPAEYLRYIQNILYALGIPNTQLSMDPFIWPMVKNSQVDQSEFAARQTIEAFLAKQVLQLNAAYVVVMGQTAAHYLGPESQASGKFIDHKQISAPIICTQSAVSSMADPELKPQIWRDLQPLHRVLKRSS